MTSRLIHWPLLEPVIVCGRYNVSVQFSSRDCERFPSLYCLDFPAFCLQQPTVVVQTTTPPTQNRRQIVVIKGLYVCAGGIYVRAWGA